MDSACCHNFHFRFRSVIRTAYNSSGMSHGSPLRSSLPRNKTNYRFGSICFYPFGCICFKISANFTNHYDTFGFRIIHQELHSLFCGSSNNWISTYSDSCSYTQACLYHLVCSLIGECSRFRDNTNSTFLKYKSRHNSNLSLIRSDNTRTIRPNHSYVTTINKSFSFYHVLNGNTFCNCDNNFYTRICSFHNCIRCKSWRHKNN